MDGEDARTTGRRVRQVRYARGKSLRVVAGLAGISASHLHRIETGERALDSVKQIVAIATALEIAPSELIRLPVPAPANGGTDSCPVFGSAPVAQLLIALRPRTCGQVRFSSE
jgi:transcriptional regulator with XRE-family HTH domain